MHHYHTRHAWEKQPVPAPSSKPRPKPRQRFTPKAPSHPDIIAWPENLKPIISVEWQEHTPDHPFCWDMRCPCHEDTQARAALAEYHREGLVSAADCDRIYQGRTV